MKTFRKSLSFLSTSALLLALLLPIMPIRAMAHDSAAALQRGYRTGYSDGYMAGYRDVIENAQRDFAKHPEYADAKRAYNSEYGSIEDYRDGYRSGFETGYAAGYEKRPYDSTVPTEITRRGEQEMEPADPPAAIQSDVNQRVSYSPPAAGSDDDPIIVIPKDVEIIVELQQDLSTEKNREGDRFTAKVVSPSEINGAIIEGRIDRIQKPGRIKRRSEMLLAFDRIVISQSRWSNMSAVLTEVLAVRGDNISRVDDEGAAIGKGSMKEDSIKVGTTTGAGLGIGALAGGPVGAAVGAGVGAAFGVGTVLTERGKHIRLNENQQLRLQTTLETRIR